MNWLFRLDTNFNILIHCLESMNNVFFNPDFSHIFLVWTYLGKYLWKVFSRLTNKKLKCLIKLTQIKGSIISATTWHEVKLHTVNVDVWYNVTFKHSLNGPWYLFKYIQNNFWITVDRYIYVNWKCLINSYWSEFFSLWYN